MKEEKMRKRADKMKEQRSRNRVGIDRSITYNLQKYRVKCI